MKPKYAVFRVEEVEGQEALEITAEVKDFFVIRFQDVFAAPGLYAYASVIQTWIERDRLEGNSITPGLVELQDLVWEAAQQAESYPVKKIPD